MITKIIAYQSPSAHYYLIENMSEAQFEQNLLEIIELIKIGKGYFPKNAIEKLPEKLFGKKAMQDFLVQSYDSLSYYTQVAVLNQLQKVPLQTRLAEKLMDEISDRNSAQNQKIITLIIKNKEVDCIQKIVDLLIKKKIKFSESNYQLLQELKLERMDLIEKI